MLYTQRKIDCVANDPTWDGFFNLFETCLAHTRCIVHAVKHSVGTGAGERVAALTSEQVDGVLARAVAAAAVTVSRPGADPPWARELA